MFLKPFRVKSNTTCKSSERKRLKIRICSCYPTLSHTEIDELLPSKCTLASIRVFTHSNSNINIFTVNGGPIFFEYEGLLCPTVYTLWNFPDVLPTASTWPYVITKLQRGADLMLPGIILPKKEENEEPGLSGAVKGRLCSVNSVGNRASLGVGVALMSYDTMVANQWRGKGLKMLHLYHDRLWELGIKSDPPLLKPRVEQVIKVEGEQAERECIDLNISPPVDEDEVGKVDSILCGSQLMGKEEDVIYKTSELHIDECADQDERSYLSVPDLTTERSDNVKLKEDVIDCKSNFSDVKLKSGSLEAVALLEVAEDSAGESMEHKSDQVSQDWYSIPGDIKVHSDDSSTESTPLKPPMDELICECFYMAIKTSINQDDLPILTSAFYRSHLMPLCPLEFNLDVKKSKYKKLSKFLSAMQDEGVLKVSEASKGVETITEIDFKHPKVKKMIPKYISSKAKIVGEISSASATCTASKPTSGVTQMTITEMYIPTHKVLPILVHYGYSTASMMTLSRVREVVTRYIKEQELVSPSNSSLVVLDPILTDSVLRKGESAPTQLSWHQVITGVLDGMRLGYSIQRDDEPPTFKRTKLEPVRLNVITRTGNKKVTLIDNLDYFGISAINIVQQVQRIAAASATVNCLSGRPPREQVMVQGNNVKVIAKLLHEQHGLPLKYIEAMDKTKIHKTHKRPGGKK